MKEAKKRIKEFATEYTVQNAVKKGDGATKLSMIIMGAGNLARKEFIKGILFLLSEISFIMMMVLFVLIVASADELSNWSARTRATNTRYLVRPAGLS